MPESLADRGARRGRRALATLGEEIRAARLAAGLSLDLVGRAASVSPSELSRVERGLAPWLDVVTAARLASVVGLDLSVRAYPGPDPVRDAGHLRILDAFRARLAPPLQLRTEVPIGDERDRRAWDATLEDGRSVSGVELESRLLDVQALVRRIQLKARDGRVASVILVLSDTNANRRAAAAAEPLLRTSFPIDAAEVLQALRSGRLPDGSGVLLLRVDRIRRSTVPRKL